MYRVSADTCIFAHQRECVCLHLRSLVRAQDFYSCKRLEELLPTMKAVTFSKRSQASIVSSLGWGRFERVKAAVPHRPEQDRRLWKRLSRLVGMSDIGQRGARSHT